MFNSSGMYIPLIYVGDFASVYGISSKLSSYFLSILGVSSIIGRLLTAWLSSFSFIPPLLIQSITQFLLGLLVCLMPVFTTYIGMATSFAFYGFLSGIFSTLSTIILYDLVGMDELTTAVGLITLSRGISSVLGAPLAAVLFEATNSFKVPYIAAGLTIIMSALLFLLILCYDWIVRIFASVKKSDRNNVEISIVS
uniref:SJCHGC04451 protein n=1 Tax=Schistosoma japonicum TaxID=6182 RepID=Q5DA49_SCHJA|nr:SJCHGC04451 protein [Schistosoma japonicum]